MTTATKQAVNEEVWQDAERNDGTWKPQSAGEVLIGTYDKYDETKNGKRLYTIMKDDGELVKVWGGTLLDSYFNHKTGVQIGERVRIEFLGKKPMMNGTVQRISAETGERWFFNDYKVQHTAGKRPESKLEVTTPVVSRR